MSLRCGFQPCFVSPEAHLPLNTRTLPLLIPKGLKFLLARRSNGGERSAPKVAFDTPVCTSCILPHYDRHADSILLFLIRS